MIGTNINPNAENGKLKMTLPELSLGGKHTSGLPNPLSILSTAQSK